MPVLNAQTVELPGNGGSIDVKGNVRDRSRAFQVVTDDPTDNEIVALGASGLPIFFADFPGDPGCKAIRYSPSRSLDNPRVWTVTVDYSSNYYDPVAALGSTPGSVPENPLDKPYQLSIAPVETTVPVETTIDATPVAIVNSAQETFQTPITRTQYRQRITLTKNYATDGGNSLIEMWGTINALPFLGRPALCVRFNGHSAARQFDGTYGEYWSRVYNFDVIAPEEDPGYSVASDNSPWDARPLDVGYHFISAITTNRTPILDDSGQPRLALLDGTGGELALGAESPVYLRFRIYRRLDLNNALIE